MGEERWWSAAGVREAKGIAIYALSPLLRLLLLLGSGPVRPGLSFNVPCFCLLLLLAWWLCVSLSLAARKGEQGRARSAW